MWIGLPGLSNAMYTKRLLRAIGNVIRWVCPAARARDNTVVHDQMVRELLQKTGSRVDREAYGPLDDCAAKI